MKIIHQNGFTKDELLTFRSTIYRNTLDSAQAIILQMRKMNVECITPANRVSHLPNSTLSTQPFPPARSRSHHRVSGRSQSHFCLLCRYRPSHTRLVARSHHPESHGPRQRILSYGLSELVSHISPTPITNTHHLPSQFLHRGTPDWHSGLYTDRE